MVCWDGFLFFIAISVRVALLHANEQRPHPWACKINFHKNIIQQIPYAYIMSIPSGVVFVSEGLGFAINVNLLMVIQCHNTTHEYREYPSQNNGVNYVANDLFAKDYTSPTFVRGFLQYCMFIYIKVLR